MTSLISALSGGWISFALVLVLVILLSWFYVRYYSHRRDRECCVTTVATLALCTVFLSNALIPVDIFLVSYMKNSDGTFQHWAEDNSTRQSIENSVLYSYYCLYGLSIVFIFVIIPLTYFFHEEKDDDEDVSASVRCLSASKFAVGFVICAGILLLIGSLIPLNMPSGSANATDWKRIEYLFDELGSSHFEDAISFTISCLSLPGMLVWITYTSYGMAFWPINMVRGARDARTEYLEVVSERDDNQERLRAIQDRYESGRYRPSERRGHMSHRDSESVSQLAESDHLLQRRQRHLASVASHWTNRCLFLMRPFAFLFGILFSLVAVLIFVALLLANIDRALHSSYEVGYALMKPQIPNPLDIVLVFSQKLFPLDYILVTGVVMFLVCCTMSALSHCGIWCCWLRMYKLRPHRTRPQGVLLAISLLLLFGLMLNIMMLALSPHYSTYGNQHYQINNTIPHSNTTEYIVKVMSCSDQAPHGECTMTRLSSILLRYFTKASFFGAAYYWGSWLIIGVFPISVLVSALRRRQSAIVGHVEDSDFDSSDDDDEILRP